MTTFTQLQCPMCGVYYCLDAEFYQAQQSGRGKGWHCPNGHTLVVRESDAEKYRREAERLKQQLAQKDDTINYQKNRAQVAERQVTAAKGQITKLKKRAKAGTCPCCKRTFQNMTEHMKNQHPEFDPAVVNLDDEKAKRKA